MNKILITGGLGFIGSHAAIFFAQNGYKVSVIDNLSRPMPNLKSQEKKTFNYTLLENHYPLISKYVADVRNRSDVEKVMKKESPDIIIHAAGQTSAVGSIENPRDDFENNVIGLYNTLEAARNIGTVKLFLYLSTNKVYGTGINNIPVKKTSSRYTPNNPIFQGITEQYSIDQSSHTPYGISKLTGDLYVQEYGYLYPMHTVVVRMSCIYGPRQFGFLEQGWVSHLIVDALLGKSITVYGDGKQVRDILYIDDLVSLYHTIIKQTTEKLQTGVVGSSSVFNVGGGANFSVSLNEVIGVIQDLTKRIIPIDYKDWRPADQKYYVSDISKIQTEFGWSPQTSPKEGISRTFGWLEQQKDLFT